jgi:hypothetical protein
MSKERHWKLLAACTTSKPIESNVKVKQYLTLAHVTFSIASLLSTKCTLTFLLFSRIAVFLILKSYVKRQTNSGKLSLSSQAA